ncbi:MAG: FKBP-type peptidyl-prolyl cis-trans isomerase [Caulobacter sp.]|nr:FKBP-type peptidyl-prolyl cis-trans isomerase [Caulobacter sp.]
MLRRALIATAIAAIALAGCGRKSDADPSLIEANGVQAKAFLETTAKEPGVQKLPSGVLYKVVASGPADGVSPRREDEVKVHYEGKLVSGDIFDSSFERGAPAVMRLGGLIPAWIEALQKMKPGDEWILYVPPALGYGEQGQGPIPPNSVLIFRIQLIGVLPAAGSTALG